MWFTRVSINNPVFATMVMAALCVLGLFSYGQLRVERLPDISPPIVFVSVAYPGASPGRDRDRADAADRAGAERHRRRQDDPLEQPRGTQRDGRRIPAQRRHGARGPGRARQGRGGAAELPARREAAVRAALRRRQRAADGLPVAARAGPQRRASSRCSPTRWSRKRLERVGGVARVDVGGLTVRQVRIDLDPQRLRAYQLDAGRGLDGAAARQRRHAGRPADRREGGRDRPRRGQDARREGLRRPRRRDPQRHGRAPRRPRHAGRARARADSISRVDGVPAISFEVFKQQDANIVETGEGVKAAAEELRKAPAAGRRAAPGLRRQRLGQATRSRASSAR